jgi:predicted LPLAT superfamily acyltransferase
VNMSSLSRPVIRFLIWPLVALPFVTSCSARDLGNREFLTRCWNASPVRDRPNEYRVSINAIVIPATEGGVFARTQNCPNRSLGLTYERSDIQERFDTIADTIRTQPTLGVGVRADAWIRVKERETDHYMVVVVTDLINLEPMSARETQRFISEFHIG